MESVLYYDYLKITNHEDTVLKLHGHIVSTKQ